MRARLGGRCHPLVLWEEILFKRTWNHRLENNIWRSPGHNRADKDADTDLCRPRTSQETKFSINCFLSLSQSVCCTTHSSLEDDQRIEHYLFSLHQTWSVQALHKFSCFVFFSAGMANLRRPKRLKKGSLPPHHTGRETEAEGDTGDLGQIWDWVKREKKKIGSGHRFPSLKSLREVCEGELGTQLQSKPEVQQRHINTEVFEICTYPQGWRSYGVWGWAVSTMADPTREFSSFQHRNSWCQTGPNSFAL